MGMGAGGGGLGWAVPIMTMAVSDDLGVVWMDRIQVLPFRVFWLCLYDRGTYDLLLLYMRA